MGYLSDLLNGPYSKENVEKAMRKEMAWKNCARCQYHGRCGQIPDEHGCFQYTPKKIDLKPFK